MATPQTEVYERDVVLADTVLISVARNGRPGGNASLLATVGGNGRFVAFASTAETLVRNDRLQHADVFLRDMPPSPRLNPGSIAFGSRSVGVARRARRRDPGQRRLGSVDRAACRDHGRRPRRLSTSSRTAASGGCSTARTPAR